MKNFLTILFVLSFGILSAQRAQDVFGKNRVQYEQLKWKYISTKNFNIYYTVGKGGNILAHNTARHLENIYEDITSSTGYLPYNKINVLVYSNHADLQQSNVSLGNSYSAGGETNLVKSKIEVAFKGNQIAYFKELETELAKLFINVIMYGGNFRDAVQSSYLIEFPEWFLSGCAHYLGTGESEEMHDAVNDFLTKKRGNIDRLSGRQATLVGASIFNFVNQKYGSYAVANILALAKSTRSEEVGIRAGLGVSYYNFLEEWKLFYMDLNEINQEEKEESVKLKKTSHHSRITQFKTNPSKSHVAYAINRKGIFYVFSRNLETNKKRLIYYGGTKDISGEIQKHIPLLSWRNNDELALIKFKKGQPYLLTKNINKRFSKEKKLFVTFQGITSFEFHPDGKELVLSGVQKGQSDIFTYNVKTNVAKRVTYDLYDDQNPVYSPDGSKILFSSNRKNDTLRADPGSYYDLEEYYELFEFTGDKLLNRITKSPLNETKGEYLSNEKIVFLSSNGEKNNYYLVERSNPTIAQYIDLANTHIYDFCLTKSGIIYKTRKREKDYLYLGNLNNLNSVENYLLMRGIEQTQEITEEISSEVLLNKLLEINPFEVSYNSDVLDNKRSNTRSDDNPEVDQVKISFPRDVVPQMGIDYVISTIEADYIRNLGALFEVGTSDMFGDHRFSGTLFTSANLRSYDMNFRYDYLARKIDFRAEMINDSYFRNPVELAAPPQRERRSEILGTASLPFSPVSRASFTTGFSRASYINYGLVGAEDNNLYGKAKLAFVYDNSTEKAINSLQGFRLKTSYLYQGKISGTSPGFTKFIIDARNYQPIFKDMVFATRFSYGSFGGTLPRVFIMGGVDNWLLQQYENNNQFDPFFFGDNRTNPYFLYSDFSTNLRGFGYNKINGRRHLLLNAELRIPIVKMLYSAPVSSTFFRNLQLNLFYETGSAWNGSSPFKKDNSINTRNVGGPPLPFSAVVTNYQNPFLSSYGFGVRSMMFGYYMKVDLGWGIKNFIVQRPKLQVSLGYDF